MDPLVQLVSENGEFNRDQVDQFLSNDDVKKWGKEYKVVAIMGPQSSGKSTFLNAVFGTKFVEMNAAAGRSRTTKGVWMAQAPTIDNPVLVLDLEGNDGRERGEEDTAFEKQAALFAVAVADILVVNLWCHDIGREHGAGKPLLKTVLEVNLKLFDPRKTVLLFTIRDKTKTPLDCLAKLLTEDMNRIWDSIPKPPQLLDAKLTDFFDVKFAAMSHYEMLEADFLQDAADLCQRFAAPRDAEGALIQGASEAVPSGALRLHMERIWEQVKANKDLNLPAQKVMVATVRCEEMVRARLQDFHASPEWTTALAQASQLHLDHLGPTLWQLIGTQLAAYDDEAQFFDAAVREEKREELVVRMIAEMLVVFKQQLHVLHSSHLASFMDALAVQANSTAFATQAQALMSSSLSNFHASVLSCMPLPDKEHGESEEVGLEEWRLEERATTELLQKELSEHVTKLRAKLMEALVSAQCKALAEELHPALHSILEEANPKMWEEVRQLLQDLTTHHTAILSGLLEPFAPEEEEVIDFEERVEGHGREVVCGRVRDAAAGAVVRMREAFQSTFQRDEKGMPQLWGARADIPEAAKKAKLSAARVLALLTVSELDEDEESLVGGRQKGEFASGSSDSDSAPLPGQPGLVLHILQDLLTPRSSQENQSSASLGQPLWRGVPAERTFISPIKCRELWRQFQNEVEVFIQQAVSHQEAARRANSSGVPLWALAAMVILGFDEAMAMLYNPLYLVLAVAFVALAKGVYERLDVQAEMSLGLLPGLVALAPKLMPALVEFIQDTLQKGQQLAAEQAEIQRQANTVEPASNTSAPSPSPNSTAPVSEHSTVPSAPVAEGGLRQRTPHEDN
mmetsp:Transcript_29954/g.41475  ORF Transcript_29954/g.41475 Transcript_29954/m.41475 type:complete len:854 (-) Transcript_29954:192-2753(-)|eukprot:CAMPEP_0196595556 /NCGR_PEP_ID=MMETSP1081-20130531/81353_1 /TAXON_ID=36882 /ORGANISM="Pyramimonas amylifera, Strain CCMP720" /LENGTH=853 /DNA_ID=CAMNT_0041920167 /DNA_START=96 /DNA_END=2657 /DNA_ORIENTATION=+